MELKECPIKLILMDCNMPIMDGFQASVEIAEFCQKQRFLKPLIVALTGE